MKTSSSTPINNDAQKQVPLAIVGMGCLFPKADSPDVFWANIVNRVDGITEVPETHWRPEDYYNEDPQAPDQTYARRGGFISPVDFNPMEFGISPRDIEAIDTTQLLGLVVAKQALEDAGYGLEREYDRSNTSVILGVTGALELVITLGTRLGHPVWRKALTDAGVDETVTNDVVGRISNSYVGWQENSFPGLLGNVAAGRIANRFDLGGTNCVVDAACASSLTALHLASLELASGQADMVVAGGMDTFNDIFMYMCFSKTPALSPTGNAKPFAADADGTILGEGLGCVIIKRLADAERDGDKIYSVIRGIGSSSDGRGKAVYEPAIEGQAQALKKAYERSGISPDTIELVEAHGTGTKVGDGIEVQALNNVYRETGRDDTWCALGTVKSQIGHTKAAAGIGGLIKASMALYKKVLPPTMKVSQPLHHVESGKTPFYLNMKPRPWMPPKNHPRRAAVSSFGFGGSNFHCVLEEYEGTKSTVDWDGNIQLISFSALSLADLINDLNAWSVGLSWDELRRQAGVARTRFNADHTWRLVVVVEKDKTDIAGTIQAILKRLNAPNAEPSWHTPDGVYFSSESKPGKLGMLFPGQGAQYTGMFRDLACRFPQMQEVLNEANLIFQEFKGTITGLKLTDFIYPRSEFTEDERQKNESDLRDTTVAQPALGAVSLALTKILKYFGVDPDAAAGHSYGELVALCVAGRYKDKVLHTISNLRGQLMAEKSEIESSMLAVQSSVKQVLSLIKKEGLDLVIANKNAPNQTVLSGALKEIEKAAKIFTNQKVRNKKLNVSAAFHSEWVAHARKPFEEALQKIRISASKIPVYANTTGNPYPKSTKEVKDLLAGQLARPVEFIQEIENMYESGVRTFLEIGPGNQLTGLVRSILDTKKFSALALDTTAGKRSAAFSLALVLAQLSALGYAVDLDKWDDGLKGESAKKPGYTVSLCGANYFNPKPQPPVVKMKQVDQRLGKSEEKYSKTETDMVNDKSTPDTSSYGRQIHDENAPKAGVAANMSAPSRPVSVPAINASNPAISIDSESLNEALQLTQKNMNVLQQIQTQTADLHRQFLVGQEKARQSLESLIDQQRSLFLATGEPSGKTTIQTIQQSSQTKAASAQQPVRSTTDSRVTADNIGVAASPAEVNDNRSAVTIPKIHPQNQLPGETDTQRTKIENALLSVVSEKTGYPPETLELNMNLDIDLGIDSIKRVEILSTLQDKLPDVPAIGPEHLGEFETLVQIVDFLYSESKPNRPLASTQATDSGADSAEITTVLLEVVANKTGYPVEMLTLDMGLDSDLGIDSIKRVEILSELQERLSGVAEIGPDQIGVLQTLSQIVDHLSASRSASATGNVGPQSDALTTNGQTSSILLEIVAEKTGYPVDMLNLEMGLDADLGIDSIKRVEILSELQEKLPDSRKVGPEHLGELQTLGQIVEYLGGDTNVKDQITTDSNYAAAPVSQSPSPGGAQISSVLIEIVSNKTGYPVDMLNLDMGLDSDLGIDSIKRVEILSDLQDRIPEAPKLGAEQLGTLQTLGEIVGYLSSQSAPTRSPVPPVHLAGGTTGHSDGRPSTVDISAIVKDVVSAKTGYPVDMLSLEMEMDTDLGIDSIKRVEILSSLQDQIPDAPNVAADHLGQLQTLAQVVEYLTSKVKKVAIVESIAADSAAENMIPLSDKRRQNDIERHILEPIKLEAEEPKGASLKMRKQAHIWITRDGTSLASSIAAEFKKRGYCPELINFKTLVKLDTPSRLDGLVILSPKIGAGNGFLKSAFNLLQRVSPVLRHNDKDADSIFATVSRLDGTFGLTGLNGKRDPFSGGLAGLSKTASQEWPDVHCKALDLNSGEKDVKSMAKAIVDEIIMQGPVEVGISSQGRYGLRLCQVPLVSTDNAVTLDSNDVVVISGGARGVTAEAAVALARTWKPKLVLLGRSPAPQAEEDWLIKLTSEADIKKALLAHAATKLTPRKLESDYQSILANREMRNNFSRIEAAGSEVLYKSVDVRDKNALDNIIQEVHKKFGAVTGLIHGAGVIADKRIEEKTDDQFERVYSTKVGGQIALLSALAGEDLKFMVLFSSSTGRYGRIGQVDYAVANEVLNKIAQQQSCERKNCRVVAFNWGPWDGGMVTPALKKIFEKEDIGLIPLEAGAQYMVQELQTAGSKPVEIVVLGSSPRKAMELAVDSKTSSATFNIAIKPIVSLETHPFLKSHIIDGQAVMPMAIIMEWMINGAIHNNPGLKFRTVANLKINSRLAFDAGEAVSIVVKTGQIKKQNDYYSVPVNFCRILDNREIVHASAEVVLGTAFEIGHTTILEPKLREFPDVNKIYGDGQLFHGKDFRCIQKIDGYSDEGIIGWSRSAPDVAKWIESPLRKDWLSDPLVIDCSFQLMILWSIANYDIPSLPIGLDCYRQYKSRFPKNGVRIVIRKIDNFANRIKADIEFQDREGQLVARIEGYTCLQDKSLYTAFRNNKLKPKSYATV